MNRFADYIEYDHALNKGKALLSDPKKCILGFYIIYSINVGLRVSDVLHGDHIAERAVVMQQKTMRPVQFELTEQTRHSVKTWIKADHLTQGSYLFPSRVNRSNHLSTRQYSRLVDRWIQSIGLDPKTYATHSLRRTKASLIYRRTKNLRAIQLLLGHTKLENTIRYLGIEIDDALDMAEQTEA